MAGDLAIILLLIASGALLLFLVSLAIFLRYAKFTHYYLRLLRDKYDARAISFPSGDEIIFLRASEPEEFLEADRALELLRLYAPIARRLAYCVRISFLTACLAGALCFIAFSTIP